jgi:hypothetical protein
VIVVQRQRELGVNAEDFAGGHNNEGYARRRTEPGRGGQVVPRSAGVRCGRALRGNRRSGANRATFVKRQRVVPLALGRQAGRSSSEAATRSRWLGRPPGGRSSRRGGRSSWTCGKVKRRLCTTLSLD